MITFDPSKRDRILRDRGLDFEDAALVFEGAVFVFEDLRKDYGERRFTCIGHLRDRMVAIATSSV